MSTERVIVQRGAEDALTKELIVAFKQVKIGDLHTDPTAILGSMLAHTSADNVIKMMQDAVAGGAEVVVGDMHRREGIVQPHILRGVKPGMSLWDKESFGPGAYLNLGTSHVPHFSVQLSRCRSWTPSKRRSNWRIHRSIA